MTWNNLTFIHLIDVESKEQNSQIQLDPGLAGSGRFPPDSDLEDEPRLRCVFISLLFCCWLSPPPIGGSETWSF